MNAIQGTFDISPSITNKVNFLQLNLAHRLWAHEALMSWLATQKEIWILCLQEPYFAKKGLTKMPREYGGFWADNEQESRKARAIIIAPRNLNGYMVTQRSTRDCVIIRFDSLKLSVASMYCPTDGEIQEDFGNVVSEQQSRKNVICCMDANAYHTRWGSNLKRNKKWKGKERGKVLCELIDENNFMVCNNTPHLATFLRDSTKNDESHIDVTICTNRLFNDIHEWCVKDETYFSDHRAIQFSYLSNQKGHQMNNKSSECKVPWKKPSECMKGKMECALKAVGIKQKINGVNDVDCMIKQHTEQVLQVLQKVFKKKERPKKSPDIFWWTSEVAESYKILKRARRRMRRYGHRELREEFRESRKLFRQVARENKIRAWRKFVNETRDPWERLIKIVKATSVGRIQSRTLHDLNGVYATDLRETLCMLGVQFYPPPMIKLDKHRLIETWVTNILNDSQQKGPKITICEMRCALQKMSTSSAPGFDQITTNVVRMLMKKGENERKYHMLFNVCLQNYYFPIRWKEAKIVLIPKAANDNHSVKAYRPISLTSVYAKWFERIILARLLHYLQQKEVMSRNQHAYNKGKSAQTALFEMFDVIQYGLHKRGGEKSICVIVFLDISGAFDRTWHLGILGKLLQYGVPIYLVKWMRDFLTNRKAFFMEGSESHEMLLEQGCPQGGVLSPVLWNVLFNELLALPIDKGGKKSNCLKIVGYADDAALVCKASNMEEASALLNCHLEKIRLWAIDNRVIFNTSKLAVLTVSNRVSRPPPATVYYNGILITEVERYKYLGLLVDNKCSWKPHIQGVLERLALVTRSLRGLAGLNWGINLNVFQLLFHAIFVPVMTYGISIWGWKAISKRICNLFDQQIRSFGLLATGCQKSTASTYVFHLLKTHNFAVILEREVLKTSLLQYHVTDSNREEVYDNYLSKRIRREVPQCMDHHYYMCRRSVVKYLHNVQFDDEMSVYYVHPAKWGIPSVQINNETTAIWKGADKLGWTVFTDASRSTHGVGWGFVGYHNGFCVFKDSGALSDCTIFAAEAYALWAATSYVCEMEGVNKTEVVDIRCDSKSLVTALMRYESMEEIIIRILDKYEIAKKKGIHIRYRWIPSHKMIDGNESADKLAKKGTDSRDVYQIATTQRDIRRHLKEKERVSNRKIWDSFASRTVKSFLPDINQLHVFMRSSPSRALCQIISGHSRLNDFMCVKLGIVSSSLCKCKKAKETVSHFFFDCELYDELRVQIWNDFEPTYAYISHDWELLNQFVVQSGRFNNNRLEK